MYIYILIVAASRGSFVLLSLKVCFMDHILESRKRSAILYKMAQKVFKSLFYALGLINTEPMMIKVCGRDCMHTLPQTRECTLLCTKSYCKGETVLTEKKNFFRHRFFSLSLFLSIFFLLSSLILPAIS